MASFGHSLSLQLTPICVKAGCPPDVCVFCSAVKDTELFSQNCRSLTRRHISPFVDGSNSCFLFRIFTAVIAWEQFYYSNFSQEAEKFLSETSA